jgi:NTE family protein
MPVKQKNTGLILTGGGARGAYQAGVLQGIAEIAKSRTQTIPCDIISGASAGALNVGFIAATADNFSRAARQLSEFWSTLKAESVFRTDVRSLSRIGLNWATDLTLGNARKQKQAVSLVDTSPLKTLISSRVPFNGISKHLSSGVLNAVEVSALDYSTSENVSFIMSRQPRAAWVCTRGEGPHLPKSKPTM